MSYRRLGALGLSAAFIVAACSGGGASEAPASEGTARQ